MWENPRRIQNLVVQAERLGLAIIRNGEVETASGRPFTLLDQDMTRLAVGEAAVLESYLTGILETRTLH